MENNNLEANQSVLSDMDSNNVENIGAKLFEETFGEPIDGLEPSEQVTEVEADDQLEEVVDEVQVDEPIDDHSDTEDELESVEAEETELTDEDDQTEEVTEVDTSDMEIVSYDELSNHLLEFGGETYTAAQLNSILGQEVAAGTKAREAADALKDVEVRIAELDEREGLLNQRNDAVTASDDMVKIQQEARQINAKIEKARSEGDMYEVTMLKDRLEVLGGDYNQAKSQVDVQNQEVKANQIAQAEVGLKDRGLGYLLQDGPAAQAWSKYVNSNLTEQEAQVVTMVPGFAEMAEKARKWDNANGKSKSKKLKTSGKTLKAGSGKSVSSKQSVKETNRKARLRSGEGTQNDVDKAAIRFAEGFFNN